MNEREIFSTALEIDDPAERAAWLDQICAGDEALRNEIDNLLEALPNVGNFMDQPAVDPFATKDSHPEHLDAHNSLTSSETSLVGSQIGPYKLVQKLGEGGMGELYVAEQSKPVKRRVALKIIKSGMDSVQVIRRFEAERQALAMMDHSNIAKVFDAGTTDGNAEAIGAGRPYFVMELVKGIPITKYCDELQLPIRERLGLFIPVCRAIQHAHQKGIIHRDIKPSNVLVCIEGGNPLPKVIDFGVAKALHTRLTDQTMHTEIGQIIGTLEYMSPEQAELSALDIDTRADVYALGVLLYELLTGSTPLDRKRLHSAAYSEMLRLIKQVEPPKPSTRLTDSKDSLPNLALQRRTQPGRLTHEVRGDLDWIVMKCLEKDRTRRYASSNDLANDIQRYLTDEPVEARPPSAAYRLQKFGRKYKTALVTLTAFFLLLLVAACVSTWLAIRATLAEHASRINEIEARKQEEKAVGAANTATKAKKEAVFQRDEALRSAYLADMRVALEDWQTGQTARLYELLARYQPQKNQPDVRGWEWHYLLALCHQEKVLLRGHKAAVWQIAWNPRGDRLASGGSDGTVRIWDVEKKTEILKLKDTGGFRFAWSPDGKTLATAGKDRFLRLWNANTGKLRGHIAQHDQAISAVAWNPNGKYLATASRTGSTVKVWDVSTKRESASLKPLDPPINLVWSPDGTHLAAGYKRIDIWNARGKKITTLHGPQEVFSMRFHPDGKRLATGGYDSRVHIWDVEARKRVKSFAHPSPPESLMWSPDGTHLAVATRGQKVRVWNAESGKEVAAYQGHVGWVMATAWQPNGKQIASAGFDGTIRIWQAPGQAPANSGRVPFVVSPDRSRRAECHGDGAVIVVDTRTGTELSRFKKHWRHTIFWQADSQHLVSYDSGYKVWDAKTGIVRWHFPFSDEWYAVTAVSKTHCAYAQQTGTRVIEIWNLITGKRVRRFIGHASNVWAMQFSRDGQLLATATGGGSIKIWNGKTGQLVRALYGHAPRHYIAELSWSSDGRMLASAGWDQSVKIWEVATGKLIHSLEGHTASVLGLRFSHDNSRIVTISSNSALKIWDVATGREVLNLSTPKRTPGKFAVRWPGARITVRNGLQVVWELNASKGYALANDPHLLGDVRISKSVLVSEKSIKLFAAAEKNSVAWDLAADPKAAHHDPIRAAQLAREAVDASPANGNYWNTLGVALYRNNDFTEAIKTLTKSNELLKGNQFASNGFYLSMAHAKLGNKQQARNFFDRADSWLKKNAANDPEMKRVRDEAMELLK